MSRLSERIRAVENILHASLVRHAVMALRITVGAVFLGFGVLKFFPGVSPAEGLAIDTIDKLTFGIVPWRLGIVATAVLECAIGILLLANRWMRVATSLLAIELVGVLAPLFVLPGGLFGGPHHAPTLEGQYVLKDVILVAAGMVIAAGTFRGGHMVRDEPQPDRLAAGAPAPSAPDGSRKVEIVLSAIGDGRSVDDVCREHEISPTTYYAWRDQLLNEAGRALDRQAGDGPSRSD